MVEPKSPLGEWGWDTLSALLQKLPPAEASGRGSVSGLGGDQSAMPALPQAHSCVLGQPGQEPLRSCLWSGSTEDSIPETGFLIHGRGNHLPLWPSPHLHSPWSSARSKFRGILGRNVKFIFCKNQAKSGKKIYTFSFSLAPSSKPN